MSLGAFTAGPYHFSGDDGYAEVDLGEALAEVEVDDFDQRLLSKDNLPNLDGAPLASWLLARLEAIVVGGGLAMTPDVVEHVEGGVWVVDFVVTEGERAVAKLQLQAGMIGAGVLGAIDAGVALEPVLQALQDTLLSEPAQVQPIEVRIVDPDWAISPEDFSPTPTPKSQCRFGFDGARYLGADNPAPR